MENTEFISVVMPCYNEGKCIYNNIFKTIDIMKEITSKFEIICVNDGSSDETLEQIKKASEEIDCVKSVSYDENKGKGHALKVGTMKASGDYIAFVDSDLELSPRFLADFLKRMKDNDADVVIGSKMHPESVIDYPFHRKVFSLCYYLLLKMLFRLKIKDTQTGLKLFKADVIKTVMPLIVVNKYAFDIEVLSIINRRGGKIIDAPIELFFSRANIMGRIRFIDIWNMLIDTFGIFYRLNIKKIYD